MEDVPVGPGPEQYMHTLTNSSSSGNEPVKGPAMVLMPGYGAGSGFFFRCSSLLLAQQLELSTAAALTSKAWVCSGFAVQWKYCALQCRGVQCSC